MSVLPAISDLASVGGPKTNLTPVVDPTTDEDAADRNVAFANATAVSHTVCRAWRAFIPGVSPSNPSTDVHDAVWGDDIAVLATVTKIGTGVYDVTWPATVQDFLGDIQSIDLRRAWCGVEGTTPLIVTTTPTASNVFRVRIFDAAGAATDGSSSTITVYAV